MYVKSLWNAITRPLIYGNTAATTGIKMFPNALAQDTKFARSIRNWLAGIFHIVTVKVFYPLLLTVSRKVGVHFQP